jgi:hypothetical protein
MKYVKDNSISNNLVKLPNLNSCINYIRDIFWNSKKVFRAVFSTDVLYSTCPIFYL